MKTNKQIIPHPHIYGGNLSSSMTVNCDGFTNITVALSNTRTTKPPSSAFLEHYSTHFALPLHLLQRVHENHEHNKAALRIIGPTGPRVRWTRYEPRHPLNEPPCSAALWVEKENADKDGAKIAGRTSSSPTAIAAWDNRSHRVAVIVLLPCHFVPSVCCVVLSTNHWCCYRCSGWKNNLKKNKTKKKTTSHGQETQNVIFCWTLKQIMISRIELIK